MRRVYISCLSILCASFQLISEVSIKERAVALDALREQRNAALDRWSVCRADYAQGGMLYLIGSVLAVGNGIAMLADKRDYRKIFFGKDLQGCAFWKRIFRDKATTIGALRVVFSAFLIIKTLQVLYEYNRKAMACRDAERNYDVLQKECESACAAFELASTQELHLKGKSLEALKAEQRTISFDNWATEQVVSTLRGNCDTLSLNSRAIEIALRRGELCDGFLSTIIGAFKEGTVRAKSQQDLYLTARKLLLMREKYNLSVEILVRGYAVRNKSNQVDCAYTELVCMTDPALTQKLEWVATVLGAQERALRDAQAVAYDRLQRREKELAVLNGNPLTPY